MYSYLYIKMVPVQSSMYSYLYIDWRQTDRTSTLSYPQPYLLFCAPHTASCLQATATVTTMHMMIATNSSCTIYHDDNNAGPPLGGFRDSSNCSPSCSLKCSGSSYQTTRSGWKGDRYLVGTKRWKQGMCVLTDEPN